MSLLGILLLALALAADAFSVAVVSGAVCQGPRPAFRLSFHFGLFQALMPALGALGGAAIRGYVAAFDHWIAFGLLAAIGLRMIAESFGPDGGARRT
jgi:putative Mn2+ efflux pump MntP